MSNKVDSLFNLPLYPEPDRQPNGRQDVFRLVAGRKAAFDPTQAVTSLRDKPESVWVKQGEARALALFKAAATYVPAYRDYLKKLRIRAGAISSFEDFQRHVPIIDKETYLKRYPLEQLTWHGSLASSHIIVTSSGSLGPPWLWPRGPIAEAQNILEHELILFEPFQLQERSTLALVCFHQPDTSAKIR